MKKKIIICALLATTLSHSKNYIGVNTQYSRLKYDIGFIGADNNGITYPFTYALTSKKSLFGCGFLIGRMFEKVYGNLNPFIEADYMYSIGKTKQSNIEILPRLNRGSHALFNENIEIKNNHQLALTLGINMDIDKKISALVGFRFNATLYDVTAYHVSRTGANPEDRKTKKTWMLGVEPTIGAQYKISENTSCRLVCGYNFVQSKKVIDNYIGYQRDVDDGIKSGFTLSPSSFNIRASLIYSF